MGDTEIFLTAGDKDDTDSYIIVMLSKEEMAKFSADMFDEPLDPNFEYSDGWDGWRQIAQKVGSALWAMYSEQYPEPYEYVPESEEE